MHSIAGHILGYGIDLACFFFFAGNYKVRRGKLYPLFAVVFFFYSIYRVLYGYTSALERGGRLDLLLIPLEILVVYLALRAVYNVSLRAALVESMMLVISMQVGRKIYYNIEAAVLPAVITASPILSRIFAGANKVVFAYILRPRSREMQDEDIHTSEMFLLAYSIFLCLALAALNVSEADDARLLNLDLICYLGAFVSAFLVKRFLIVNHRIHEMERIRADMKYQYELYSRQREHDEELRCMYHDMKHQLQALQLTGQMEESAADSVQEKLSSMHLKPFTSNALLNAILNEKARAAEAKQIRFSVESGIGSFDFIEDTDIVSIFSNALDNALEAAEQCSDRPFIRIRYTEKSAFLLTVIENSFNGRLLREDGELRTTKEDASIHGIGLKSIQYALARYDGTCSYKAEDGVFSFRFLIPRQ